MHTRRGLFYWSKIKDFKLKSIIPTKNLTIKQKKFIRALVRTGSPTDAAMQSYNCKDRHVASVIANQNLTKLDITMSRLMEYMGLDEKRDIEDLKALREAKETKFFAHEGKIIDSRDVIAHDIRYKALELSLKIKDKLNDRKNGSVDSGVKVIIIKQEINNGIPGDLQNSESGPTGQRHDLIREAGARFEQHSA